MVFRVRSAFWVVFRVFRAFGVVLVVPGLRGGGGERGVARPFAGTFIVLKGAGTLPMAHPLPSLAPLSSLAESHCDEERFCM